MEILVRERRRRWSTAERLEIVAAVGVNARHWRALRVATMCRDARSTSGDISSGHQLRKRGLLPAPAGPAFLPVNLEAPMGRAKLVPEDKVASPVIVDLCLAHGWCLRFDVGSDAAALTQLIRSVEAA